MLLNSGYEGDQTEFEKLLYKAFADSPDTLQLISILKRKLSIHDPVKGAHNVKILDEMLKKEPLRKFVLFAKRYYESDQIYSQIAKVFNMHGNEKEVFKNEPEYHI